MLSAFNVSRQPTVALFALGLFWGPFAAWLPDIKAAAGVGDATMGLTLLGAAFGNILVMAFYPALARRFGQGLLPATGVLLSLATWVQLLASGGAGALFAAMFVMGATMASLDVTANVQLSLLEARHRRPLMNLAHGLFSLGFAIGAALAGLARINEVPHAAMVAVMAAVLLAMVALMRGEAGAPPPAEAEAAPVRTPWIAVLPAGLILFCSYISENATETWSALHIERTLNAPPGEGAFGPAMMGLTMAVGRLSGQAAAARWGEARLVAVSTLIGVAGALTLAAAPSRAAAILGVALIGVGVVVVVPSATALIGARVTDAQRSLAVSRAMMLGFTGFFVGPVLMGWVAEAASLRIGFVVIAGVIATILIGLALLLRRPVVAAPD